MTSLSSIARRFAHVLMPSEDYSRSPDGYITCSGLPMGYWLPKGLTMEDLAKRYGI